VLEGILAHNVGENCVMDDSYFIFFYVATQMWPNASIYRDFRISSCVVLVEFLIGGSPSKRGTFTGQDVNIHPWPDRNSKARCLYAVDRKH
jgi:hypothetical protein